MMTLEVIAKLDILVVNTQDVITAKSSWPEYVMVLGGPYLEKMQSVEQIVRKKRIRRNHVCALFNL